MHLIGSRSGSFRLLSAIPGSTDTLIGSVLERRYRVLERLGTGGMGTVYLAEHITLARKLAIKVLKEDISQHPEFVARFMREARAASAIAHPNVIEVLDTGTLPNGSAYFVMEYLQGEDLARTLQRELQLPWSRVRHIALQICDALAAAHARNIVHRDLKPANCLRTFKDGDPDRIKILDFGIAKLLDGQTHALTGTGEMIGTAAYMAPEQAAGEAIDHRVDIYALGVMLYQFLTGIHPYAGRTSIETLYGLLHRTPMSLRDAAPDSDIPDRLEAIVARAMHRDLAQRFPSMRELAAALTEIPEHHTGTPAGLVTVEHIASSPLRTSHAPGVAALGATAIFAATDPATASAPAAEAKPAVTELAPPLERPSLLEPAPAHSSPQIVDVAQSATMAQRPRSSWPRAWLVVPAATVVVAFVYLAWPTSPPPPEVPAAHPQTPSPTPPIEPTPRVDPIPVPEPTPPPPTPASKAPEPAKPPTPVTKKTAAPKTAKDAEAQLRGIVKNVQARCHPSVTEATYHLAIRIEAKTGNYTRLAVLPPYSLDRIGKCITDILRDKKNSIRPFTGADLVRDDYPITLKPAT
jgi:serine/threonine protein kinase